MKKIRCFYSIIIVFASIASVVAQQVQIEGNSQFRGILDLSRNEDLTTVNIGVNSGLLSVFGESRHNTFNGYSTGFKNSTGSNNAFYGSESGIANTTGGFNSFVGYRSGSDNLIGMGNSYVGVFAGSKNTAGGFNTAMGGNALFNSTSTANTAMGYNALYDNSSGSSNTAVGYEAMDNNQIGSNNTALGHSASFNSALGNLDNTTCIGYQAGGISNNHNRIEIGNTSVSWIGGQVGWSTYSDRRIKTKIKENVPGIDFIKQLRPVTYHLNIRRQNALCFPFKNQDENWSEKYALEEVPITGFIAQEVAMLAEEIGYQFSGVHQASDAVGMYSLSYAQFVVPLVKAVQEQQEMIQNLLLENKQMQQQYEDIMVMLQNQNLVLIENDLTLKY